MDDIAIKVDSVSKNFKLPHEKVDSIKSLFVNPIHYIGKNRSFESQHALRDVTFEVKKGEFFGIVGRNGSGKSTMLKMLAGIYQPTKGKISLRGKLVPFIELGVGFNPELTGRENVYLNGALLGFSKKEVDERYDAIVEFAEIEKFMDQKLKNYSSGMQVRLAFSMAIRAETDILLVDEVLAVGDADFQRKCFDHFRKLKRDKKTVIFVTHDMDAVREYCDRAIMIEKSKLIAQGSSEMISSMYTKMFIEDSQKNQRDSDEGSERWGTRAVAYKKPTVTVGDKKVTIMAEAEAREDVAHANFGFSLKDTTGQVFMGTNSQIKKVKVDELPKGSVVSLTWEFPNIFRNDTYELNLAVVDKDGEVWDWWESAATFRVFKEEKTTYRINPEIDLILKVKQ
jgi:ABC-2 type transport system ATP-binding protein